MAKCSRLTRCILVVSSTICSAATISSSPRPDVSKILDGISRNDQRKQANLQDWSVIRHYTLKNSRASAPAELTVRVSFERGVGKSFEILSATNANGMCRKVLDAPGSPARRTERLSSYPQHQHPPRTQARCAARRRRNSSPKACVARARKCRGDYPHRRHPLVYGDWLHAPGKPTVLCYGHYDVQPPDPLELWISPPFEPVVRDGQHLRARLVRRQRPDVHAHQGRRSPARGARARCPSIVKFLIEGEEEVGGAAISKYVAENPAKLKADVALVSDTATLRGRPSDVVYRSARLGLYGSGSHAARIAICIPASTAALRPTRSRD
jgi:hypothetical protein